MSTLLLESIQNKDAASPSIYINAAGNVGIGTTSPATKLEVASPASTSAVLRLSSNKTGTGAGDRGRLDFYSADNSGTAYQLGYMDYDRSDGTGTASYIAWANRVAGTVAESMRIDSLGKLLVGTTDTQLYSRNTGSGFCYRNGASLDILSPSDNALILNRAGSDGSIAEFRKDGTTLGSIGASGSAAYLVLNANSGVGVGLFGSSNNGGCLLPANETGAAVDNVKDLGRPDIRWDDIYATNGTIQTSDRNEKQDIDVMSEAETRVAVACKGLIRKFRWIDAVAEKGDDARIHFGIIAQDLQDAFTAEGLDAGRYAMFISSTWWEADRVVPAVEATDDAEAVAERTVTDTYDTLEEAPEGATERTRLGVRYPELLAFIIGAPLLCS